MSTAQVLNFKQELASAEAIAAERRRALENVPELTAEEIIAGFKRELRAVAVPGFGTVYHYHPISLAERLEIETRIDNDSTKARSVVQTIIALARNSDGSQKFTAEAEAVLLNDAPWESVIKLAHTLVPSHRFSVASAEKK